MNKMPLLEDTVCRENEICTQMAILNVGTGPGEAALSFRLS